MRVTVKIGEIEVTIDRPKFEDYKIGVLKNPEEWKKSVFNNTIIPTLEEAAKRAKELHKFQTQNPSD